MLMAPEVRRAATTPLLDVMQAIAIAKRPHIIVGTPGRVVDHLSNTKVTCCIAVLLKQYRNAGQHSSTTQQYSTAAQHNTSAGLSCDLSTSAACAPAQSFNQCQQAGVQHMQQLCAHSSQQGCTPQERVASTSGLAVALTQLTTLEQSKLGQSECHSLVAVFHPVS